MSTVVDPHEFDVDNYIAFSLSKGMKIAHVIDTHIQADHISGGRLLAEKTGATYHLHQSADVSFQYNPLQDNQLLECGNVSIRVLHTPGHTQESVCLLVTDKTRSQEPWFLLTGDTLFVGSVGRPDLPGQTEENARQLYKSLHDKVLPLPEFVEIYPTHFAGSACGKGISGKPASTLAFEKRFNPLLSLNEAEFVAAITKDIPPKPQQMMEIIRRNRG